MMKFTDKIDGQASITLRDNSPEGLWLDVYDPERDTRIAIDLDPAQEAGLLDYLTDRANAKRDRAYKGMVARRDSQGKRRPAAPAFNGETTRLHYKPTTTTIEGY